MVPCQSQEQDLSAVVHILIILVCFLTQLLVKVLRQARHINFNTMSTQFQA